MPALLGAATSWLLFAALVVALGSVAARWALVPRAALSFPEAGESLRRTAGRLGSRAAALLPVAMALVFLRQLVEFRDPFATWSEDAGILLGATAWGHTWLLATGISLAAFAAFTLVRAGLAAGWWLVTAAVLALAAFPALSGHASGSGPLRPLAVTADVLHVVAAGAWVGGLTFVLAAERDWRRGGAAPASVLPTLVPLFSPLALASVGVLVVTGGLAAFLHVEGLGALFGSAYGRLLLLKLAAVAAVMALGAVNWRRLTARLGDDAGPAALRRTATAELVLAQIVLVVTAVLVRTPPPGASP